MLWLRTHQISCAVGIEASSMAQFVTILVTPLMAQLAVQLVAWVVAWLTSWSVAQLLVNLAALSGAQLATS